MQAAPKYPCQFGKYVLARPLATGGMAEVFLAQMSGPAGFDKACVVKRVLRSHVANAQYMQMFLDEARVISRLSHPNVVQVFDMGQVDDDYFMAMEYVPGVDLQNLLDALPEGSRRLSVPVACRIVAQVAEGLDHAHRAVDNTGAPLGIVHRDVSPSNIIISVDGVAKICDFGIAKFGAQVSTTEVGSLKGKIHYMSPEQVRGDRIDARSDLFSLGAVLYEATIGVRPFDGHGPADIALKLLNDDPKPPEMFFDGFPAELWAVIQCLLAKRPIDRFGSGRELQVALDELLMDWKVRASSNEVAAALESAIPGIGAKVRASAALAMPQQRPPTPSAPPPKANALLAVGPTSKARPFPQGSAGPELSFGDESAAPTPVALDLSGPSIEEESDRGRRRERSSSGWIAIVAIVAIVGVGFYWLTQRADGQGVAPGPIATPSPSPSPVPTPSPSPSPAPTPVPSATPTQTPTPTVSPLPPTGPVVTQLPVDAPKASPKPAAPKHVSHPRPHEDDDAPKALPRLPTPPPTDDAP